MKYCYFEDGTYLEVDATGNVYDIPGNTESIRIIVTDADAYFKLGSDSLVIGDCKKPANSGDACSAVCHNSMWIDVKCFGKTKIAIKSTGISKVWLIPVEERV